MLDINCPLVGFTNCFTKCFRVWVSFCPPVVSFFFLFPSPPFYTSFLSFFLLAGSTPPADRVVSSIPSFLLLLSSLHPAFCSNNYTHRLSTDLPFSSFFRFFPFLSPLPSPFFSLSFTPSFFLSLLSLSISPDFWLSLSLSPFLFALDFPCSAPASGCEAGPCRRHLRQAALFQRYIQAQCAANNPGSS